MPTFGSQDFPPLPTRKRTRAARSLDDGRSSWKSSDKKIAFATINDLPDELILGILHYLLENDLDHFRMRSLISLSRTNRNLHRVVADKLYVSFDSLLCEPYLFLRTVISNRRLAEYVRHVRIDCETFANRKRKRYIASAQDKKIIKEGIKALGIPDNWKSWATECNAVEADSDVLYTAILMHTPNIASIKACCCTSCISSHNKSSRWLDLIRRADIAKSIGKMHRFESLKSLTIEAEQGYLSELCPIFRTPLLRKVHLKGQITPDRPWSKRAAEDLRRKVPQRCNNLEELHLEDTYLQMDILGILISSPKSLKILDVKMHLGELGDLMDDELDIGTLPAFAAVLQPQKRSLESLAIDIDHLAEINFGSQCCFNIHGDLQDFLKLKSLSCPIGNLASTDNSALLLSIPPSLKTLHLIVRADWQPQILSYETRSDTKFIPLLEEMADTHDLSHPKTIRITVAHGSPVLTHDWTRLMASLSRNGIDLVVENEPVSDDGWDQIWANVRVPSYDTSSSESSDEVSLDSVSEGGNEDES